MDGNPIDDFVPGFVARPGADDVYPVAALYKRAALALNPNVRIRVVDDHAVTEPLRLARGRSAGCGGHGWPY
jgi:hypothetical protein